MRRKSERTISKKKSSPDKKEKVEKVKRRGTRRSRKPSSSSESGSTEDTAPKATGEVSQTDADPPKSVKEDSPEETQEQVWHVKATETSGDVGEIQKLKICLARPPSTPERADRSPRSKRKHSRATSSSDTQSVEGEEKKKSKHRSKRLTESKEAADTSKEDHDEADVPPQAPSTVEPESTNITSEVESTESNKVVPDETPMSTTNEESKDENVESTECKESEASHENVQTTDDNEKPSDTNNQEKPSDADTTVVSPKPVENSEEIASLSPKKGSPERKRSLSVEKSEILELHAEDSRCESSEISVNESQDTESKAGLHEEKNNSNMVTSEVSNNENSNEISGNKESNIEENINTNQNDVVESTISVQSEKETTNSTDSVKEEPCKEEEQINEDKKVDIDNKHNTESTNEQGAPIVINRKRRWGSRPSKLSTQRSITISTDVLKEIIPDVKPAEFDEVIDEKKHKRVEMYEKIDRPVLPKIVIDNTEHIEVNNKDQKTENGDKENVKLKEINLASTRKISIVKENDSIITRPPSPPRHKQSSILYITNLVRPFTLPQLKNLLQRTGRIVENGFWIDRIKSKCFVKYEREDQAVETRHALHGVTWPVSNPKTLHVDFSTQEDFDKAIANEDTDNAQHSTIPGTVEDWLREQDMKREKGELEKPWERKAAMREWDVGKNDKSKEVIRQDHMLREDRPPLEKRRHRTPERSPEPARKFKKKEDEAPAKLLDDLFKKTKTTPCIYWLPLSAETIAVKEEQRRQHMAEHERRLQELRRTHRRH